MRPPRVRNSSVQYPLDEILGTAAHVRLMRVLLHDAGAEVSVTSAARRAGLSTTGARNTFESLVRMGVARRVGSGRALKYGPIMTHPLVEQMQVLFEGERRHFDALMHCLQSAMQLPEVTKAWVKALPASASESLEIDVVVVVKALKWIGPELRARVIECERSHGIVIEINVHTRADSPIVAENAIMLSGHEETGVRADAAGIKTRIESEQQSLRIARSLAALIRSDPSVVRRALRFTELQLAQGQGMSDGDLMEWRQILMTYGTEQLGAFLVSNAARALRLRRSMPFLAILTPQEHARVIPDTGQLR